MNQYESFTDPKFNIRNMSTMKLTISKYVFSKVIKCLEKSIIHSKNIRNHINHKKRPSNTEQMNRAQIIRIEVWKH